MKFFDKAIDGYYFSVSCSTVCVYVHVCHSVRALCMCVHVESLMKSMHVYALYELCELFAIVCQKIFVS